ncbi:xanthine dehydrogenase family protein molybdopterin-binding subunit [Gaiella sp.]|jgi:2-furoyl-CoA dehydrogenase large subunit|uniref:xanthine dehydrogenase family protein molybdopterin-binding subunit n=1 Tax=Gaiella sp. TaxID=2663207 RepID=UPI002E2F199C|nr:xanthine dehydrogenase family protein molybdopterin-binding subunit [Gaiella sp.]HEX5583374.1 xanthine dehydrogenase family protein molybdopterin-binding subunit [Gaiella sp.]
MTTVETQETVLEKGFMGQNVPRKEDRRLVEGQGQFVDDVKRHGMGYLHFVRSPYAHARIVSIDVAPALELPGVYGTLTGDEAAILTDPFFQIAAEPGGSMKDYALAVGKVRYVGDPVAAVVAESRELARDAAELVEVEYEPLDVVVDARKALEPDAPVLHEECGGNLTYEGVWEWGDVDRAFAEADHVVKISELHFDRFNSTPLELDAALVEYNRGTTQWTITTNNQFPGFAVIMMAPAMRVGTDKLRFVTQDIGGGFGNKITTHPQLVACCLLARKLNRPVQWTEWRTDFHQSMSHGNERWFLDTEVAVLADGTMTGFRTRAVDDAGAYLRYEPLGGVIWSQVAPGLYGWRNIRLDFTQAVTNKAPCSPNRGYSRMQHLWFTERLVDIVAQELGFDRVELRKKNYVQPEQMPYETPNGCVYDSGDYPAALDVALGLIDYDTIEERRADAGARGKLLGVGIGSTLDSGTNNFGQSQLVNPDLQFSGNNEVATVKLDIFGEVVVTLGTTPQGQSHETTASQVVADILGCDVDAVHVRAGHDSYWNSHAGFSGTYASQFAVTGLGAVKGAADMLADQMKTLASMVFQCPKEAIELADGFARIADNPEAALPFMALGAIPNANNAGFPIDPPPMNARFVYRPPFEVPDKERKFGNLTLTYSMQIHACVVEVDPETGVYEIVDYAAVDDCGVRINPKIVEGQVMGATAHAIGAAMFESYTYDDEGNLLTPNFYDYHVPHTLDMPPLQTAAIETPSPFTPLGTKGMGEGGGGGIHCICAALQDALRASGSAIVTDSHNPYHRVFEMLRHPEQARAKVDVTGRAT